MELTCLEFLNLDQDGRECVSLLVVTDNLSGSTQAYATRKNKGKTAAESLFSDFMLRYRMSSKILDDKGGKSGKLCLVNKMRSIPYHFKTTGKIERMNQTIISMLRTLPHLHKNKRKHLVKKLVFPCNCTKYYTSGYSPFTICDALRDMLPFVQF